MKRFKSIKFLIWFGTFFISFAGFYAAILLSLFIFYNMTSKQFDVTSKIISDNLNKSILEIMNKDFKQGELKRFVTEFDGSRFSYPYKLEIFGVNPDSKKFRWYGVDDFPKRVYESGDSIKDRNKTEISYGYPIKLTENCMKCHSNERIGDILAVLTIKYDISHFLLDYNREMLKYFIMLFPLPLIFAFFVSGYINRKLNSKFTKISGIVENINSLKDLKRVELEKIDLGFEEFSRLADNILILSDRIRNIAVDKSILEFEIKILDKFIITSEIIKDWKENVKNILQEVNSIIEAYAIFSLFRVDNEVLSLEIFWIKKPSIKTVEITEKYIKSEIIQSSQIFSDVTDLRMEHSVCNSSEYLKELTEEDIAIQTKSLILDAPKIGGVVGIGLQSQIAGDKVNGIIIEGILATLMNVVGSVKAISKYTKQLEYYTTRDPLTNLFNQRVFWEMLSYEVGRAGRKDQKFAIILIDIDNFKNINDTYGHITGDYIIAELSGIIRQNLRKGDILARYSGDQFVAILPEAGEEQAYSISERIRESAMMYSFYSNDGKSIKITLSIGISIYPVHGDNSKDLFIFADNLLKRAKDEGKNRVVIPKDHDVFEFFKAISDKTILVTKAVNEKRIIPYFQPIMNNSNKEIEFCEVLSRIDTQDGIINAHDFIEIAEKIGVISKLDLILLENAIIEVLKS
ncbi:MAG: diguanylate cyclase, partial [Calditerrivibrio sp.]|nr:diguanylate cyclase [Calditerrivibrio sp.]